MAKLLVVAHALDDFRSRAWMIQSLFPFWLDAGHEIRVIEGPPAAGVQADLAFLHVDASCVPAEYVDAVRRFPVVVNGHELDLRKSVRGDLGLQRNSDWQGPVIVKSDLNAGGVPEAKHNDRARALGCPLPHPGLVPITEYVVFRALTEVPEVVWSSSGHVVERFLPERDERGYWTHFWLFLGKQGRCRRFCSPHPVVKAGNSIDVETVDVPPEIVAVREQLGLDYGKIDFVIHQGRPVVIDVNRTPAPSPTRTARGPGTPMLLAPGIEDFLRR
ncbi:MAG TPA: hypothetical protein VN581_06035 [Patescibacteria group bacterium]|nr:hypothetical protein [Patescibacteria group bacterium]